MNNTIRLLANFSGRVEPYGYRSEGLFSVDGEPCIEFSPKLHQEGPHWDPSFSIFFESGDSLIRVETSQWNRPRDTRRFESLEEALDFVYDAVAQIYEGHNKVELLSFSSETSHYLKVNDHGKIYEYRKADHHPNSSFYWYIYMGDSWQDVPCDLEHSERLNKVRKLYEGLPKKTNESEGSQS